MNQPQPLLTPPVTAPWPLVLCADGGGSKICVVIRSSDGIEVRGNAGPCNVISVGFEAAIQRILLATYRALSQLPPTHFPQGLLLPNLSEPTPPSPPRNGTKPHFLHAGPLHTAQMTIGQRSMPASPYASRPTSPSPSFGPLPPLPESLFQYVWLALAGISTAADSRSFMPFVTRNLNVSESRIKITNDVNLLAAPALKLAGIEHVAAVVCGTGTVGRTIKVDEMTEGASTPTSGKPLKALPLEDIGVSRGWGYVLCDEGSAFWIGRLAIRALLQIADRASSTQIYSTAPPPLLPLYTDLLAYFGTPDPMELINITSLTGPYVEGLSIGEATAKRNAFMAGAARVVFKYAFPEDGGHDLPPSPPTTENPNTEIDPIEASHRIALKLAETAVQSLIELTVDLLGDGTVVKPESTALALGGGLWMSGGYRQLFKAGLKREGVVFREVIVVPDAAGAGAAGLASVEFGI